MKKYFVFRVGSVALMLIGVSYLPAFAQKPADSAARVIKDVDSDNDGTISLVEVDKAASKRFDRLEADHDGTLTLQEFEGTSTPKPPKKEFLAMDKDHDGTVSKEEYLAEVDKLFKQVDTDNDGKIDAKELRTSLGKILQTLLN